MTQIPQQQHKCKTVEFLNQFEENATQITYSLNRIHYLLKSSCSHQTYQFIQNEWNFLEVIVKQVGSNLLPYFPCITVKEEDLQKDEVLQEQKNQQIAPIQIQKKVDIFILEKDPQQPKQQQSYLESSEEDKNQTNPMQQVNFNNKEIEGNKQKFYQMQLNSCEQNDSFSCKIDPHEENSDSNKKIIEEIEINQDENNISQVNLICPTKNINQLNQQNQNALKQDELKNLITEDVSTGDFSYTKICKKYNIKYSTAYYLVNQIQKELEMKNSFQDDQKEINNSNDGCLLQEQKMFVNEKVSVSDNGRFKYNDTFKLELFTDSVIRKMSYKQLSEKHKISYESCYYLINSMKIAFQKGTRFGKKIKNALKKQGNQNYDITEEGVEEVEEDQDITSISLQSSNSTFKKTLKKEKGYQKSKKQDSENEEQKEDDIIIEEKEVSTRPKSKNNERN